MAHPRQSVSRRMRTFAMLAALTALMGIGVAACGSSDDDKKATDDTEQADGSKDDAVEDGVETEPAEDVAADEGATDEGDEAAEEEPAEEDEDA